MKQFDQLLEDIEDFLNYGPQVLSEEEANAYLDFLKASFDQLKQRNDGKDFDLKSRKDITQGLNTIRVQHEIKRLRKNTDYFEGKDLQAFASEVEKLLKHPENIVFHKNANSNEGLEKKELSKKDKENFETCYKNYYQRLASLDTCTDHDLRRKVGWKWKDTEKDLSKMKKGSYSK